MLRDADTKLNKGKGFNKGNSREKAEHSRAGEPQGRADQTDAGGRPNSAGEKVGHPRLHRGHLRVGCRWLEGTGSRNPGDDLTLHTRVRPASSEHRYEGCIRGPTAVTLSSPLSLSSPPAPFLTLRGRRRRERTGADGELTVVGSHASVTEAHPGLCVRCAPPRGDVARDSRAGVITGTHSQELSDEAGRPSFASWFTSPAD